MFICLRKSQLPLALLFLWPLCLLCERIFNTWRLTLPSNCLFPRKIVILKTFHISLITNSLIIFSKLWIQVSRPPDESWSWTYHHDKKVLSLIMFLSFLYIILDFLILILIFLLTLKVLVMILNMKFVPADIWIMPIMNIVICVGQKDPKAG